MEVNEIKHHIQTKQFNKFYIFAGIEWKIQQIYIHMISKTAGKELRYIDSISDVSSKLNNSAFVQKSYVYVVRDDKELIQNEKLQNQLESMLKDNMLILLLTTLDKRLKFYKTYKDTIVEFEPLKPSILMKYIQNEINLSNNSCEKLMEVCEYDYGRCLLEIDKIKNYHDGNKLPMNGYYDGEFEDLLNNGTIYQPPKDAIFDFVDAILDRKIKLAFELYNQCLAVGEATMVMLSVLYNNTKAVLQVQTCESSDVSKSTGLTGFQIMNAKKHCNKYFVHELLNIMKKCQYCQQSMVTGTMDEEFVMEYLLVHAFTVEEIEC